MFKEELPDVLRRFPIFLSAYIKCRLKKSFVQKIMLAVSAINGCTYCTWFHGKMALLLSEMDLKTIENILKTELGQGLSEYEIVGLAYAQHYATTNRKPDPEATQILYDYYGKKKAEDIIACIDMIHFANLAGNTFDALMYRLKDVHTIHQWVGQTMKRLLPH